MKIRISHAIPGVIECVLLLALTLIADIAAAQPITVDREQLKTLIREIVREEIGKQQPSSGKTIAPSAAPAVKSAEIENKVVKQLTARAEEDEDNAKEEKEEAEQARKKKDWNFSVGGYGDIQYAHHDYSETGFPQEDSRGQSRVNFDLERFTMELEGEHKPSGVEFEAEVEFEHGGTGTSTELDYDEFGEFETEVEKGGEVELEELYLKKKLGDGWSVRAGKFYVESGLLPDHHKPTDYLASSRPEVETTVIPGVWAETGGEVRKNFDGGKALIQVVNGLDSTGFSASRWTSSGKQGNFEATRAEDLAAVARFDLDALEDFSVGASAYYGGTTQNRPKADLDVDGNVFIGDVHARYWAHRLRAQGSLIWGHLDNASEISARNSRLSNNLDVERTAVADEALGLWFETGYDIAPFFAMAQVHRIDPYIRYEYYDTYYGVRDNLPDNDRYERNLYTAGISYTYDETFTTKLDYTIRQFGLDDLSTQNTLRLGLGFNY